MRVPALLYALILREIDVTLITRYFQPYLRVKLHILSVTLVTRVTSKGVTGLLHECPSSVTRVYQ